MRNRTRLLQCVALLVHRDLWPPNPQQTPMERLWVEQAQRGDLAAFNAIVERYQKQAYNLAFRMLRDPATAEDATQEAFFSAFRSITRFRGGNLRSWLLTILANGCRDYLRSPQRWRTTSLDAIVAEGDPGGPWASPDPSPVIPKPASIASPSRDEASYPAASI